MESLLSIITLFFIQFTHFLHGYAVKSQNYPQTWDKCTFLLYLGETEFVKYFVGMTNLIKDLSWDFLSSQGLYFIRRLVFYMIGDQ